MPSGSKSERAQPRPTPRWLRSRAFDLDPPREHAPSCTRRRTRDLRSPQLQSLTATLAAAKDNTIYSVDPVTGSNGAGDRFFCGTDLGLTIRRGLIAFDVAAAIPAG